MVNDKEAIAKMATRIHAEAEERRAMEREIYKDYKNGLTTNQISSKYHVKVNYINAVIARMDKEEKEKFDFDKLVQASLFD